MVPGQPLDLHVIQGVDEENCCTGTIISYNGTPIEEKDTHLSKVEAQDEENCCEEGEDKKMQLNQAGGKFDSSNAIQRQEAYDSIGLLSEATNVAKERLRNMLAVQGQQQLQQPQQPQQPSSLHESIIIQPGTQPVNSNNRIAHLESKIQEMENMIRLNSIKAAQNRNKVIPQQYGTPDGVLNNANEIKILQNEIENMEKQINELENKLATGEGDKQIHQQKVDEITTSLKNLTAAAANVLPIVEEYVEKSQDVIGRIKVDYAMLLKFMNDIFPLLIKLNVNLDEGLKLYEEANNLLENLNKLIEKGDTQNITTITEEIANNATKIQKLVAKNEELKNVVDTNKDTRTAIESELNKSVDNFDKANTELLNIHKDIKNLGYPSLATRLALKTKEYEDLVSVKEDLQQRLNKNDEDLAKLTKSGSFFEEIKHTNKNNTSPSSNFKEELEKKKNKIATLTNDEAVRAQLTATVAQITALKREQINVIQRIHALKTEHKNLESRNEIYKKIRDQNTEQHDISLINNEIDTLDTLIKEHVSKINDDEKELEKINQQIEELEKINTDVSRQASNEFPRVNQTRKNFVKPLELNKLNSTQKAGRRISKSKTLKTKGKTPIKTPTRKGKKTILLKKGARLPKLYREIPPLY